MRIAIYGAGSLGTALGAYIAKAGYPIELINRNAAHVAALKEKGARVTGTVEMTVKVNALTPDEMSGVYDVVFLMTKQLDNVNVVRFLAGYLAPDGVICTMQNGLPEPLIAEIVGEERTFGCAIGWGATMNGAGATELTSEPSALCFSLGGYKLSGEKFDMIVRLLQTMGPVQIERNFIGARWSKLLINSAFSGLSTVLGCTFGEICDNKKSRAYAQAVMKECIDVCAALRIRPEPVQGKDIVKLLDYHGPVKKWISRMIIPIAMKKHRRIRASMLTDIENGKRCEIEAINGAVAAAGCKAGVPTPRNDRIIELIRKIEAGELKPGFENLKRLNDR
ncbi:2-dehydropantoate 2-reductase [Clostridia bacterium]|nr:2-dehydropantoate 2-reductase [Clostridia bacterium]